MILLVIVILDQFKQIYMTEFLQHSVLTQNGCDCIVSLYPLVDKNILAAATRFNFFYENQ